jgi:hypothetical protein
MNTEQFAELLNGRQYRDEITSDEELLAHENGLLVLFGASDDLLELRGIIYDEVGAYGGGSAFLAKKKGGLLGIINDNTLEDLQDLLDENDLDFVIPKVKVAETHWCPSSLDCPWLITTDFPHSTFDIMEEDDLYCRGVVIDIRDIKNALDNFQNNQNK